VLVTVLVLVPVAVPVLPPDAFNQIWSTHTSYRLFAWHDTRMLPVLDGVRNMLTRLPHSRTGTEPLGTDKLSTLFPEQPLSA
jgi:hypothetical protein